MIETGKNWDLLPSMLCEIRMMPNLRSKLSTFEIVMGGPFPIPWVKGNPGIIGDQDMIIEVYARALIEKFNSVHSNVFLCFPLTSDKPTHDLFQEILFSRTHNLSGPCQLCETQSINTT